MRTVFEQCFIAGWDHADGNAAISKGLITGQEVKLRREAENKFDTNAIEVMWAGASPMIKLGYVPRVSNGALALLLDEGRAYKARVVEVNPASSNPWKKCAIRVEIEEESK